MSTVSGDIYLVDRQTMQTRRLTHTEDSEGQPMFSADGASVIFRRGSNLFRIGIENGYAHLYAVNADGSDKQALTSGEWEVLSVTVPEQRSHFLLRTNEGSPFNGWRE